MLSSPVAAQDYDRGAAAYEAGDYGAALKEFRPLAESGNVSAQYNLGIMYYYGEGVLQDYKEAARLFRLAAEQGLADAQYNLANRYYYGEGVIKDIVYAHMWKNISASNGIDEAREDLKIIEKKMTSSDISEAQRLARECVKKNYKGC